MSVHPKSNGAPSHHAPVPYARQVVLAATHHDPHNAMLPQMKRVISLLSELYASIVVLASPSTGSKTAEVLAHSGVRFERQLYEAGIEKLGLVRLDSVRLGVEQGAAYVHRCDWDRVLHWAELYPEELRDVVGAIPRFDLLLLGRTPRAFASHPRVQRDTETLVNHTFGLAFGQLLDVTAGAVGLSRRAAKMLLELETPEPTIGTDCAWPLYLAQVPELVVGYTATEGLEWETPDRYADEIAAAGGLDAWSESFDANPEHWEYRVQLALHEVAAVNRWQ